MYFHIYLFIYQYYLFLNFSFQATMTFYPQKDMIFKGTKKVTTDSPLFLLTSKRI